MNRRYFKLLSVFLCASLPLRAQSAALSLELGSSRMRFADSLSATSVAVTPAVRVTARRASLSAFGTFSQLRGASSNSGTVDASVTTAARGLLSAELEGIAGGSAHSDGTRTGQMLGMSRVHLASSSRGAWLGGGLGRTWDGAWRGVIQGDGGAWLALGATALAVSLSPTVVDDTIKYVDSFLSAHSELKAWELDGSLGFRSGSQIPTLPANRTVWGSVGATFWATPRLGVIASAGAYPVDFTQGYPGGQYVSLSVRLRSLRREAAGADAPRQPAERVADRVRSFEARRVSGNLHRVRVFAPGARSVELSGDFTGWAPVALTSEGGGWWTTTMPITPGTHEINVRVDGGSWLAPPGLTSLTDEFGGVVGLLVVP